MTYQPSCAQIAEWTRDVQRATQVESCVAIQALRASNWNIYEAIVTLRGAGPRSGVCYETSY